MKTGLIVLLVCLAFVAVRALHAFTNPGVDKLDMPGVGDLRRKRMPVRGGT
jgi:hypothetical protein